MVTNLLHCQLQLEGILSFPTREMKVTGQEVQISALRRKKSTTGSVILHLSVVFIVMLKVCDVDLESCGGGSCKAAC